MYLRLRHFRVSLEKIEVTTLIGLADMLGKHRPIAARVFRRRRRPCGLAAGQFRVANVKMDAALVDVDLDFVAGLHEVQRTADKALRRNVQNAGPVALASNIVMGGAGGGSKPANSQNNGGSITGSSVILTTTISGASAPAGMGGSGYGVMSPLCGTGGAGGGGSLTTKGGAGGNGWYGCGGGGGGAW